MHWEWVLPVIFLIVWIVSSLIQGNERERARNNRSKSLPGGERQPGERATRRPPSDIDRFLEEVNRRRRQAAERRPVPPSREKPPIPSVSPVAPSARPRVSARPPSGRPTVPAQPVRSPSARIPEVLPVAEKAAAEVLAVASALQATPSQRFPSVGTVPPPAGGSAATEAAAPALPPLADLLRSPENLRTAVVLHEIFGPPRSRRHGIR